MPRKKVEHDPSKCINCAIDPATIHTKPTGGNFPKGQGLCRECYERAIRSGKTFFRGVKTKSLDYIAETDHITDIF